MPDEIVRALVTARAPLGSGGLGRNLEELADHLGQDGTEVRILSSGGEDPRLDELPTPVASRAARLAPLAWSQARRQELICAAFDRRAARWIADDDVGPGWLVVGTAGQALRTLRAARRRGASTGLLAANSHVDHVHRQHRRALTDYPLERGWLGANERRRTRLEYALAGTIIVASDYTAASFLERGVAPERLVKVPLSAHPRFRPPSHAPERDRFEIVYIGALRVTKGVPLLLDAVDALTHRDVRLTLVGGPASRGMRRHLEARLARDERIRICPGDPLPHLQRAHLHVHPTYEDGLAYAPLEAVACGVPVLVTEDTGMKERLPVRRGDAVLPTGDLDALVDAIDAAYRRAS